MENTVDVKMGSPRAGNDAVGRKETTPPPFFLSSTYKLTYASCPTMDKGR